MIIKIDGYKNCEIWQHRIINILMASTWSWNVIHADPKMKSNTADLIIMYVPLTLDSRSNKSFVFNNCI